MLLVFCAPDICALYLVDTEGSSWEAYYASELCACGSARPRTMMLAGFAFWLLSELWLLS